MKKIAILASGEGTNAERIIRYFLEKRTAEVALVIVNKAQAGVLKRAERLTCSVTYPHSSRICRRESTGNTAPISY